MSNDACVVAPPSQGAVDDSSAVHAARRLRHDKALRAISGEGKEELSLTDSEAEEGGEEAKTDRGGDKMGSGDDVTDAADNDVAAGGDEMDRGGDDVTDAADSNIAVGGDEIDGGDDATDAAGIDVAVGGDEAPEEEAANAQAGDTKALPEDAGKARDDLPTDNPPGNPQSAPWAAGD